MNSFDIDNMWNPHLFVFYKLAPIYMAGVSVPKLRKKIAGAIKTCEQDPLHLVRLGAKIHPRPFLGRKAQISYINIFRSKDHI